MLKPLLSHVTSKPNMPDSAIVYFSDHLMVLINTYHYQA